MRKMLIILLLATFCSCKGKSEKKEVDSLLKIDTTKSKLPGSINGKRDIDSVKQLSQRDDTPTPEKERKRLLKTYNQVKIIDSTFINKNDTLHFYLKYYCLKESNLVVPKSYQSDEKIPKDFFTHEFASDILLIHNRDTVFKKQFKASDFHPYFEDNFGGNLKKYGSILMPYLSRRNKDKSQIVLVYSIAIPATDIGNDLFLIISGNGSYRIVENY